MKLYDFQFKYDIFYIIIYALTIYHVIISQFIYI